MDNKTHTRQTGKARSKLLWIERDLGQVKGNLYDATRYRIIGSAILLISLLVLSGLLMKSSQLGAIIATAGLVIGDLIFIRALMTTGAALCSVNTFRAWQRIASYASTPDTGTGSEKWGKLYLYEPLQMEPPTPNRVDRTRSATDYCGTSCSQADAEKRTALGVGILDIRSID